MSKFREFWIRKGSFCAYKDHFHAITNVGTRDYWEGNSIHVIEYAALEQANEEIELLKADNTLKDLKITIQYDKIKKLEAKLSIAVEALEFYADNDNWRVHNDNLIYSVIDENDIESLLINEEEHDDFGGKRARQALKETQKRRWENE